MTRLRSTSILSLITTTIPLAISSTALAEELRMPTRGDAFATEDTYMVTSGHGAAYNCTPTTAGPDRKCELDITSLRWGRPLRQLDAISHAPERLLLQLRLRRRRHVGDADLRTGRRNRHRVLERHAG